MAIETSLTETRDLTLAIDNDSDGVMDPGDTVSGKIHIVNTGPLNASGLVITDDLAGLSLVPGSVKATPVAIDDSFAVTGNTPVTFTFAQLLGNDSDPDGAEANLTITGVSGATNGTVIIDAAAHTVTFTPTTGLDAGATASFQYTITDEQGLASVNTAAVNMTVSDVVWYVDASYSGANGASDGSYLRPFTSLAPLNNNGTDVDGDGETIFVANTGTYTAGIALEANQKLLGDGHAFSANGVTIGANIDNTVLSVTGTAVTMATGNTVSGFTLNGGSAGSIAISDGGSTVGNLTIDTVAVTGQGQIIDIDQGGMLNVTLQSAATGSSAGFLDGSGAIDLNNVSGSFTVTGATSITGGSHTGGGIDITNSTALTVNLQGNLTVNTGGSTAINYSGNAGASQLNLTGAIKDIDTTSGTAINIGNNTSIGSAITNITGGGLDIDTTSGKGIVFSSGGTLTITGSANTVNTGSGQILDLQNGTMGGSGIQFDTLATSAAVLTNQGNAININNLDAGGAGVFNGGAVKVTGTLAAGADGINISGGSNATFNFTSATIDTTAGDAIEINGTGNGNVMIGTADFDGMSGNGVTLVNHSGAFTIGNGSIGATNDPAGDVINISGGTGAVSIGASMLKNSTGNAIDISGRTAGSGTVTFSGDVTKSSTAGNGSSNAGALIQNNTGGTINFTGDDQKFVTGGAPGVSLSNNTGATINFSPVSGGGGLDITTTTGPGLSAIGGGTLNVTGNGNTITSTTGIALAVQNTTIGNSGLTFESISSVGAPSGIVLNSTGTGGLRITGDSGSLSNASGGTIQNTTGPAISLTNASNVSFDQMTIQNGLDDGIYLSGVNNFALTNSTITNNGNALTEHGIDASNLTGVVRLTNDTFSLNEHEQVHIDNTAGAADIEVNGSTFSSNGAGAGPNGSNGITVTTWNAADADFRVLNSTFDNLLANSVVATNEGTGTLELTVTNSVFANVGTGAIAVVHDGAGTVRFNLHDNPTFLRGTNTGSSHTINISQAAGAPASALLEGQIVNNAIGNNSSTTSANAGGDGIRVSSIGSGTTNVVISGNVIQGVGLNGIDLQMGDDTNPAHTINATIFNNAATVSNPTGLNGIRVIAGTVSGDVGTLRLDMHNNTASSAGGSDIYVSPRFNTVLQLLNYAGGATDAAAVQSYLDNAKANDAAHGSWFVSPANAGVFANAASVLQPTLPSPIMLDANAVLAFWQQLHEQPQSPADAGQTSEDPALQPTSAAATASGNSNEGTSPPVDAAAPGDLTVAALTALVDAAIARWQLAGASSEQITAMRAVDFGVVDMTGVYLGQSSVGAVALDSDGASHGWFVDTTPGDDGEFSNGQATPEGGAAGKLDLLTVIMHELGHQIGLGDDYKSANAGTLMYGYLGLGERRAPTAGEVAAASGNVVTGAYALTPVNVDMLPVGKAVDVYFDATVDTPAAGVITNPIGTATVSGNNFNTVNASTTLTLDTLTLGNQVFLDADKNGVFDAGDSGIDGVAVTLFVDNGTTAGAFDASDTQVATTVTASGGLYSFAGLAPGEYIVRIDAANFAQGGALDGKTAAVDAGDPDSAGIGNVDHDSNGSISGTLGTGGFVASQAITLAYNSETTADGTGHLDINQTLDFGFRQTAAPVANDDSLTVSEDAGAVDLTAALLGNDTDANSGSLTITGYTAPAHGTVTVSAGLLSYAPSSDYNGTDSFTYTVSDDDGNTATGTATVVVTAVNDPVHTSAPSAATYLEDADGTTIQSAGGGIPLSISDVDVTSAPGGIYDVTLSATHGTLTLASSAGLTFTVGDDTGDTSMTFHGTLADINTALATASYSPDANYHGAATISIAASDAFGGIVASGSGVATMDGQTIDVTVTSVNDAPSGADNAITIDEDAQRILTAGDFGFSDIDGNGLAGVKITTLPAAGSLTLHENAVSAGQFVTLAQLTANQLVYAPAADANGAGYASLTFQVQDDGGTINGGVNLDLTPNTLTFGVTPVNDAPTLTVSGEDFTFTEGDGPHNLVSTALVTDAEANYAGGTLTLSGSGAGTGDSLTLVSPDITVSTADGVTGTVRHQGTEFATFTTAGPAPQVTFENNVTAPMIEALIKAIAYTNSSENPGSSVRHWTITLADGAGVTSVASSFTSDINVVAVDDAPVAVADSAVTAENTTVNIAVTGNDTDVDGGPNAVAMINGVAISSGGSATLASGATVKFESDGTLTYDPNGKFNTLTSTAGGETGAANTTATDSFTYTLTGGSSGTVTVTVHGVAGPGDWLVGTAGNDYIIGTEGADLFMLQQGGEDTAIGLGSNDGFYLGAALSAGDDLDGGAGTNDQLGLQGDYSAGLTLGAGNLTNIESMVLLPGSDTRFGDLAGNHYSYSLTMVDANVDAGQRLTVNWNTLRSGENVTFNGSGETNGSFLIYGGLGDDHIAGGRQADGFFFGTASGRVTFGSGDTVDGQGGADQLGLQGNYSGADAIHFGAAQLTSIDTIVALSAADTRFGSAGISFSYDLTTNDGNVAASDTLTINANALRADETLTFNGAAETDGKFVIFSGAGDDLITGGAGDDKIYGAAGTDSLTGGLGNDTFAFLSASHSTSSARDWIHDFASGDKLDLHSIDADINTAGNQDFSFIGTNGFGHTAGELRYEASGGDWLVQGDIDGNGTADFELMLTIADGHTLGVGDFLL